MSDQPQEQNPQIISVFGHPDIVAVNKKVQALVAELFKGTSLGFQQIRQGSNLIPVPEANSLAAMFLWQAQQIMDLKRELMVTASVVRSMELHLNDGQPEARASVAAVAAQILENQMVAMKENAEKIKKDNAKPKIVTSKGPLNGPLNGGRGL